MIFQLDAPSRLLSAVLLAVTMSLVPHTAASAQTAMPASGEVAEILGKGFADFQLKTVTADGVSIGYRVAGEGPVVVLIHGFPESGYEWREIANELVKTNRVVVPDYRGAYGSSKPETGYDKATMARDIHGVMLAEGVTTAHVVGHDIGMPIAYAYARQYPGETTTLSLLDGIVPGTAAYQAVIASGNAWHFGFSAEVDFATKLLTGRENLYVDRIFDNFTVVKTAITSDERAFYITALRAPGALVASLKTYAAFAQDAEQNQTWFGAEGMLSMPVLVAGGEASLGALATMTATEIALDPYVGIIRGAGHFVAEEQPDALIALLREHFARSNR